MTLINYLMPKNNITLFKKVNWETKSYKEDVLGRNMQGTYFSLSTLPLSC